MTLSRKITAWSLLLIFATHWVGGVVYVKIMRAMEVRAEMSQTEYDLSEKMAQAHHIDGQVKVLDQQQMDHLLKLGYATPYIFQDSIGQDGQVFYILSDSTQTAYYEQVLLSPDNDQTPVQHNKVKIEHFFPDLFCVSTTVWPQAPAVATVVTGKPLVDAQPTLIGCAIDLPEPPPWA